MRSSLHRWLLPIGLATASLIGTVETASAQPVVRDHRSPNRQPAADAGPREAPPPIREERVRPRGRGWVWVPGFYEWKGGRWEWTGGRWEKTRPGKRWRPVSWELRNGVYVRVDGDWIDDRPNQAPPPPREERFTARRGFTWVPGHWDWENGQYVWVNGKWERERRGKRWRQARWEQRDGAWIRVDGGWDDDVVSPYPREAPPPLREERMGTKAGFVWVRGKWDWRDGKYQWVDGHWERERANQRWNDGRWELRGDRWEWVEGSWGAGGPPPSSGPGFDTTGWTLLREVTVTEGMDNVQLDFSQKQGVFPRITVAVTDGDLAVHDFRIVFVSGKDYKPGVKHNFRENTRTRAFDLPAGEILRAVQVSFTRPRGQRPKIALYGKGTPSTTHPPVSNQQPPPGPRQAPPPPRAENPGTKGGFVWVRGHYEWRNNQYEWVNGHWERERARQRWVDGRWELRGGVYVWVAGGWQ